MSRALAIHAPHVSRVSQVERDRVILDRVSRARVAHNPLPTCARGVLDRVAIRGSLSDRAEI